MKTKFLAASALSLAIIGMGHAQAESTTDDVNARVAKLEEEIQLLKEQLQQQKKDQAQQAATQQAETQKAVAVAQAAAAKTSTTSADPQAPKVEMGSKGLAVTSADGNYQLRLRGYVQADNRTFIDNENKATNTDQFYIRSARPILEGQFFQDFSTRLMLDFGTNTNTTNNVKLLDAYADYKPWKEANLRIGKFKDPIGLERWESESDVLFAERGQANNLVPYRDIGLQLYGELIPKALEYQLALVNGSPDLADSYADLDNSKDVIGRVFAHPFKGSGITPLEGLGIGIAGSYGNHDGNATNSDLTAGYKTTAQSTYFSYSTGAFANGTTWRINPELYYNWGPFGLLGEYTHESQQVTKGTSNVTLDNNAYTAIASYVLTGENASFDGVVPAQNFNPSKGQWGAWEVLGRVSSLHVDDKTFPTFANIATSAKTANEKALGLTWYLNTNLKLNFDFSDNTFDGGAAAGQDRADEKVFLSRVQFKF